MLLTWKLAEKLCDRESKTVFKMKCDKIDWFDFIWI